VWCVYEGALSSFYTTLRVVPGVALHGNINNRLEESQGGLPAKVGGIGTRPGLADPRWGHPV
jgi:hypothetical protein